MVRDNEFGKIESKLYSFNRMKAEVEYIKLEIEEIKNEYAGCESIGCNEKTGETNSISKPVEKEVVKKEKEIATRIRKKKKIEIKLDKIKNAMTVLNDEEKELVQYRYFNNNTYSWEYIGNMISLSAARCKQMRIEIIDKVKDLI